jgi:phosphate transport system permease protein
MAAPRRRRSATSLLQNGEGMLWLTGGALAVSIAMIIGLLALIVAQGIETFWPVPLVQVKVAGGSVFLGEVTRQEDYRLDKQSLSGLEPELAARARRALAERGGEAHRRLLRTGNYEITNTHFEWVSDFAEIEESRPDWALVLERQAWGRFYGTPKQFLVDGQALASAPEEVWKKFLEHHPAVVERFHRMVRLQKYDFGAIHARLEAARLELRRVEMASGRRSPEYAAAKQRFGAVEEQVARDETRVVAEIHALKQENDRYQMRLATAGGQESALGLVDIVRAYPANQLAWSDKLSLYLSRWWEFLTADSREANTEGGVWPAIVGTVIMTLLMSLAVVPFGVLAALYLREYARAGPIISIVRIAVNNLAGVPSIVFGVFGLGFFCYIVGGGIDALFFEAKLPNPTFGKGGVFWSSLTLALLTLPVVIVATEEALAAVPGSLREGSYACGASKWQTIQRIILPRAFPGIMTGFILAMARGAGEVAPLMLVGAVKLAPDLPVDGVFPFLHPERSFMHLGFHIYDVGFQSQNSEAAKPMVFTTTLLLIVIIAALNVSAVWIRTRLRRRFVSSHY